MRPGARCGPAHPLICWATINRFLTNVQQGKNLVAVGFPAPWCVRISGTSLNCPDLNSAFHLGDKYVAQLEQKPEPRAAGLPTNRNTQRHRILSLLSTTQMSSFWLCFHPTQSCLQDFLSLFFSDRIHTCGRDDGSHFVVDRQSMPGP